MLTELCQYLKNWFEIDQINGEVTIAGGSISVASDGLLFENSPKIIIGQYIRIIGSVFNDGVYQYGADELTDETFTGSIWLLGIPKAVIQLANDIAAWRERYEAIDKPAMSPYSSESFKGYSYTKGPRSGASGESGAYGWQDVFHNRLAPWRKI